MKNGIWCHCSTLVPNHVSASCITITSVTSPSHFLFLTTHATACCTFSDSFASYDKLLTTPSRFKAAATLLISSCMILLSHDFLTWSKSFSALIFYIYDPWNFLIPFLSVALGNTVNWILNFPLPQSQVSGTTSTFDILTQGGLLCKARPRILQLMVDSCCFVLLLVW